jgi:hypothetical protein
MKQPRRARSIVVLCVMIAIGLVYLALLYTQRPLTGTFKADGIVSVLLGLYICSHPVANGLDVLLYRRYMLNRKTTRGAELVWWALNAAVLVTGWWVISLGMVRFSL